MNVRVGAKCLWLRRNDDSAPKLFFVMGMDISLKIVVMLCSCTVDLCLWDESGSVL